ncbi:MAG: hypothetical protein V3V18_11630 [Methylococcales bacterium]
MDKTLPFWKKMILWTPGDRHRYRRYAIIVMSHLMVIWVPTMLYLKLTPNTYTSSWSLMLPGSGFSASVSVDNIGQASTSSTTAYGNSALSPKVNYKTMSESKVLMQQAADSLDMNINDYGAPTIKLIDETAIMLFSIKSKSPELAQKKAYAHYNMLQKQLDSLRRNEIQVREENVREMLAKYDQNLSISGQSILQFQSKSEMISSEQFEQLVSSIQNMRFSLVELRAEQQRLYSEEQQLSKVLGLSAKQASDSLILQTDRMFQQLSESYTILTGQYNELTSVWGLNHPEVVKVSAKRATQYNKLQRRFQQLLHYDDPKLIELLSLSADKTRDSLFETLIHRNIEQTGLSMKINKLQEEIKHLENSLEKKTQNAANLDDLKRTHQIAEAVFTSALARMDTEKSDLYASYPLLQMYETPSLPGSPSSPKKNFVYLGAGIGSILVLTALILLWVRKPYLQKILLNE